MKTNFSSVGLADWWVRSTGSNIVQQCVLCAVCCVRDNVLLTSFMDQSQISIQPAAAMSMLQAVSGSQTSVLCIDCVILWYRVVWGVLLLLCCWSANCNIFKLPHRTISATLFIQRLQFRWSVGRRHIEMLHNSRLARSNANHANDISLILWNK